MKLKRFDVVKYNGNLNIITKIYRIKKKPFVEVHNTKSEVFKISLSKLKKNIESDDLIGNATQDQVAFDEYLNELNLYQDKMVEESIRMDKKYGVE